MSLDDFIAVPDAQIDLAGAALCVAMDEYPQLDVSHYMARLAAHADAVKQLLNNAPADSPRSERQAGAVLDALAQHLFQAQAFSGNTADYYDPRNSYLNEVLDRRVGIPITLSVVYLEVGQRLGLSVSPISFPTHFLLRVNIGEMDIVVDPYNGGVVLSDDMLIQHLIAVVGDRRRAEAYLPTALADASRREVIARMLRNLKAIYVSGEDWTRALRIVNHLISVTPADAGEFRDRAGLYAALECPQAALADYERYLSLRPDAQDGAQVSVTMDVLRKRVSLLN